MPKFTRGVEPVAFYIGTARVLKKYLGTTLIWDGTVSVVAQAQRATATATARPATGSASASATASVATASIATYGGTITASAGGQATAATATAAVGSPTAIANASATVTVATATATAHDGEMAETFNATANAVAATATAAVVDSTGSADASGTATAATATALVRDANGAGNSFNDATAATATSLVNTAAGSASATSTALVATASTAANAATGSASAGGTATAATATAAANAATGTDISSTPPVFGAVGTGLTGAGSTTANVPVPSGVASGHIIVVAFYVETTQTVTAPSGFTQCANSPAVVTGASAHDLRVFWKRATGADSGTYAFTIAAGVAWRVAIAMRVTGCIATGDPWDVTTSAIKTANTTGATPAVSVTTTGANRLLVWIASSFVTNTCTPPSGMTERADYSDQAALDIATLAQASAGSSGSLTGTFSSNTASGAWLGALLPA